MNDRIDLFPEDSPAAGVTCQPTSNLDTARSLKKADNPKPKEDPSGIVSEIVAEEFGNVESYVNGCRNPTAPSTIEKRAIWTRALEHYAFLIDGGMSAKRAGRRVRSFLFAKARFLGPTTRHALFQAFERRLALWKAKGALGLIDRRENNGGDGFEFAQEDLDVIESKMTFGRNKLAPAYREARETGKLSLETQRRYSHTPARKSYVPPKLIATLGQRPRWLHLYHRRRRDFNSKRPQLTMNYDGLHTLSCISGDDVTLPVYFYYQPDPNQLPILTRGQCLVFIDLVSWRIIGWSLQLDKNYNGLVIYAEVARLFAEKGIPNVLLFEHNIWEKSKIITGSKSFSIVEMTQGLKEFGVEFVFAGTPEGKFEIEQTIGKIQDPMEVEPGYCGRKERLDLPDSTKRQLAAVQCTANPNGKVHPSQYFYTFEQWNARLKTIFERYNATGQGGEHMRDRSPEQVYEAKWNVDDPPLRAGPDLLHLFYPKYRIVVKLDGVSIHHGGREFKYFGPELKALVGYPVLLWFNPESPAVAFVTDLKRKNAIAVPLAPGVPRLERFTNPGGTALADACKRRAGQVSDIVARYNVLKDKFELPQRKNLVDAQILADGAAIKRVIAAQQEKAGDLERLKTKGYRLGIPAAMIDEETGQGVELMAEAEREHREACRKQHEPLHSCEGELASNDKDNQGCES